MLSGVTKKQRKVYNAIQSHIAVTGEAPTYRSLMTQLGIKYINALNGHLTALAKKVLVEPAAKTMPVGLRPALARAAQQFLKGK